MVSSRGSGFFRLVFACVIAVRLGSGEAFAQTRAIHIPAQSLTQSLNSVARQTGANILFSPESVRNLSASAIDGTMTAQDAVERLIAGTDLEIVQDGNGALIVRARSAEPAPIGGSPAGVPQKDFVRETITVTGIRGSLQRDLNIKRAAVGLIDAITQEDIGKFPDSNLATAMMRIPGVTVNRGVIGISGIDSTMGDPTEITVRGFGPTFNQTLFDGRKILSGVGSRTFDFSALNADLVEEVDVLKSPDASLATGAIGATINIKYPKPFDSPGLRLAASSSTTYAPDEGKFAPNAMVLFSDTYDNDRLGILLAGAYAETKNRSNEATIWGWEGTYLDPCQFAGGPTCGATLIPDATKPVWYIQDYGIYQIHNWNMRENVRAVAQWLPTDDFLITLNGDFSRNDLKELQNAVAIWNNADEMRNVATSKNGTIIDFTRYNTPTDFNSQINEKVLQDYNVGFNVKWNVSDNLSVVADADIALSSLNPGGRYGYTADVGYGPSCSANCARIPTNGNNVSVAVSAGGDHILPYYTSYGPGGNTTDFLNPNIIGSHVMIMVGPRNRNSVNQAKLEGTWAEDRFQVMAGFQYEADHMKLSSYDNFTNNQWQAYAGYGPDSNNYYTSGPNAGEPAGVHLPSGLFTRSFSTADFIPGWSGVDKLPLRVLVFDARAVYRYLESLGDPTSPTSVPGFNWGCCNSAYNGTFQGVLNPAGFQHIYEDNYAGYIAITGDTSIAGLPLKYHVGVRAEDTNLASSGMARLPTALTVMPSDHTAFLTSYGSIGLVTAHNAYRYLLPNLDLNLHITDNLLMRFDVSRTLTRPPLANISPVTTLSSSERVGSLVATGQNPNLMPYVSDNLDLSTEWFYEPNSYISVDAYLKNVSNFIISATVTQTINNVIDPTTGLPAQFRVSSYVNGPSADVYGLEVAWQHVFSDTGFGLQANGTLVQTDKPYDPHNISTSNFAVAGLADSANMVAFYDKNGFQIRLAVNWRDSYLDHFGQTQPNSAFGAEPVFVNPNWDISSSMSYDVTDQFTMYFEAMNLLNSTYSTRGRFPEQVLDVVAYGRRFTAGVHYKL